MPFLNHVGFKVWKNARQGGGSYVIIGHVNCERCGKVVELREVIVPSKAQRRNRSFFQEYAMCFSCGLYSPKQGSKINL